MILARNSPKPGTFPQQLFILDSGGGAKEKLAGLDAAMERISKQYFLAWSSGDRAIIVFIISYFQIPESQLSDFRCSFGGLTLTSLYSVFILIVGAYRILAGAIRGWGSLLIVITGRWTRLSVRGLAIIRTLAITLVRR
jgi:hypothetical protein